MKKKSFFFMYLFMNAVQYGWLFLLAVAVTIVGAVWVDVCLSIGIGLIAVYVMICCGSAMKTHMLMKRLSDEDPQMKEIFEKLEADPNAFLADVTGNYEEMKQLHGEELLTLSDEDLYEAVYFQNLDIAEENEEHELEQFTGPRRVVYILNLFNGEIQNGGLCQFFVNSSSEVAPYVAEALESVGAQAHKKLFEEFVAENGKVTTTVKVELVFVPNTKMDATALPNTYWDIVLLSDSEGIINRLNSADFTFALDAADDAAFLTLQLRVHFKVLLAGVSLPVTAQSHIIAGVIYYVVIFIDNHDVVKAVDEQTSYTKHFIFLLYYVAAYLHLPQLLHG